MELTVLSDHEVEEIHQATLRILSETGIILAQPAARELLVDNGATIKGDFVLLPPELVEAQVAKCPSQITLTGRSGQRSVLGDGTLNWHNAGGARDVYVPDTGETYQATLKDVRDSTRLLDALDQVTTITPFFTPRDVPGELMSLMMYRHALPHTTKVLQGPGVQTPAEVSYAMDMASVIGLPVHVLSLAVSPISPLIFPDDVAGAITQIAKAGVTLTPLPCPTAGMTSPLSIAGSLAQQNAEVLASAVLAQLVNPGLPIIYCGRLAMMEPRTANTVWSGVELGLASAATVQIGRRYHLPVNVYGFSSNSHLMDIQSGFERALNATIPALAGASELSGIGEMAAGVAGSYAQMVCDNEIAASTNRLRRGFSVDEDSLAVGIIAAAMGSSRSFLEQMHTSKYLRAGEILRTPLAERMPWVSWVQQGQNSMARRASAEATRILAEHEVSPLTEAQEKHLNEVMAAAEKELVRG